MRGRPGQRRISGPDAGDKALQVVAVDAKGDRTGVSAQPEDNRFDLLMHAPGIEILNDAQYPKGIPGIDQFSQGIRVSQQPGGSLVDQAAGRIGSQIR